MGSSFTTLAVPCAGSEEGREAENLSEDMIVEILLKLPVKTLLRFKSVSKLWYFLIVSPNFVSMYADGKKKVSLLLREIISIGPETTLGFQFGSVPEQLTFRPDGVVVDSIKMVGCFNGVVCLSLSHPPESYALWNPATTQLRQIDASSMMMKPPSIIRWYGSGFCFDPLTNSFKIAQVTLIPSEELTRAQVNLFSTSTNSWTQKSIVIPYKIRGNSKNKIHSISCVDRFMHWHIVLWNYDGHKVKRDYTYILCYDIIDGVFSRIEIPFSPLNCDILHDDWNGSLALFVRRIKMPTGTDVSYDEVEVWVLNGCGVDDPVWSKLETINYSDCMERIRELARMKSTKNNIFLYSESFALVN